MKKMVFSFFAVIFIFINGINAQILFTYGNHSVSKQEFLKAYQKNNNEKSTSEKSYADYLELYVRFKLKVQAAYDMKLDTLATQKTELQNFRNQVADTYINDNSSMDKLVNEAFRRSQKDIHLAHILISVPKNATPADTLKAFQKASAAYADLKNGKDFGDVASKYSDDQTAKQNHGDLGYITVFTLPYDLENLAYGLLPGKYSKIYRSKTGYHIFKNIDVRKAIGKIRVAQILFQFPPDITESTKMNLKQKADSVYNLAMSGVNFGELAKKYSGDNLSFQTNGDLPEFGVGKYDVLFENASFALKNDGDITKPILTSFGYHIIKRLKRTPVSATENKETFNEIKQMVQADSRANISKKILLQKILTESKFKREPVDDNNLGIFTDSSFRNPSLYSLNGIDKKTILFVFPDKNITVSDWIVYVKSARNIPSLSNGKTYKELEEQFIQSTAFEYYRNHLEDYNKDFAYQLNEFKEGNMLFEIMQRSIWNKASTDTIGLKNYYDANKKKYYWEASADAVVFTCNNEGAANKVKSQLQNNIGDWKKLLNASDGSVQSDSGRFLLTQLPIPEQKGFIENQYTSFVVNQPDNTVTFAYIIKIYKERTQRTFTEARGLATNDYQNFLEEKWIEELKKKYPVKINQDVSKTLR